MVGRGIWQETLKKVKNEKVYCMTWNMARNTEKHEK